MAKSLAQLFQNSKTESIIIMKIVGSTTLFCPVANNIATDGRNTYLVFIIQTKQPLKISDVFLPTVTSLAFVAELTKEVAVA